MKTQYTMITGALLLLVTLLAGFLGGVLLNQGEAEAGSIMKTTGRYIGWRGHDTETTIQNYFVLETSTGNVNWYAIEQTSPKASMKSARMKINVFKFSHKGNFGRNLPQLPYNSR